MAQDITTGVKHLVEEAKKAIEELSAEEAVALIGDEWGIEAGEAYRLISLVCDLRITQLVDRKVGVHVMIPKGVVG